MGDVYYKRALSICDGAAAPEPVEAPLALQNDSESEFEVEGLVPLPPPSSVPASGDAAVVLSAKGAGAAGAGVGGAAPGTPRSSESSSSSSDSSSNFCVAGAKRPNAVGEWLRIEAAPRRPKVKVYVYKPKGKHRYSRFILQCTHHDACTRKRNLIFNKVHGPREPLSYLIA